MNKIKQWRVVLDAEKPPQCGDWLAANGMGPGDKETVRFTFLDSSRAEGFTFRNEILVNGLVLSADTLCDEQSEKEILWLHSPDCMEVVGVQRLDWRPEGWPHNKALWLLTLESLPSNIEFEKRLFQNQERQRVKTWWRFGL